MWTINSLFLWMWMFKMKFCCSFIMWLLFYRAYTQKYICNLFVYILYKYNSSLWIHFKVHIHDKQLDFPYHRIANFKCKKHIQIQSGMQGFLCSFFFFFYIFDSKLLSLKHFSIQVQTIFPLAKKYNFINPSQVWVCHHSPIYFFFPQFCLNSKAFSSIQCVLHSTLYKKPTFNFN